MNMTVLTSTSKASLVYFPINSIASQASPTSREVGSGYPQLPVNSVPFDAGVSLSSNHSGAVCLFMFHLQPSFVVNCLSSFWNELNLVQIGLKPLAITIAPGGQGVPWSQLTRCSPRDSSLYCIEQEPKAGSGSQIKFEFEIRCKC